MRMQADMEGQQQRRGRRQGGFGVGGRHVRIRRGRGASAGRYPSEGDESSSSLARGCHVRGGAPLAKREQDAPCITGWARDGICLAIATGAF